LKKETFFLITLFTLTFSACSGGTTPITSITGEWELISYGDASNPTPALAKVETFVIFDEAGQFHGNVGCNAIRGTYEINKNQVTISGIISTRKFCKDSSEQEKAVLEILSNNTLGMGMENEQLTLTSADKKSIVVLGRK
jgi:heat shock protein HslJ